MQGRPGVASTIIGARTLAQLDDNVGALGVTLTAAQIASLDKATAPALPFPTDMIGAVPMFTYGGTTVNGQASTRWPAAPQTDAERF